MTVQKDILKRFFIYIIGQIFTLNFILILLYLYILKITKDSSWATKIASKILE